MKLHITQRYSCSLGDKISEKLVIFSRMLSLGDGIVILYTRAYFTFTYQHWRFSVNTIRAQSFYLLSRLGNFQPGAKEAAKCHALTKQRCNLINNIYLAKFRTVGLKPKLWQPLLRYLSFGLYIKWND